MTVTNPKLPLNQIFLTCAITGTYREKVTVSVFSGALHVYIAGALFKIINPIV